MTEEISTKVPTQNGGNVKCEPLARTVGLPKTSSSAILSLEPADPKKPGRGWTYGILDFMAIEIARRYSEEYGQPFFVAAGDYPSCDIFSLSRTTRIELKVETTPLRTEKVCIEYWNNDYKQPSGILATDATLWLHVVPREESLLAIEYEVPRLKKLVLEHGECRGNHNSSFKLFPLTLFHKHSKRSFEFHSRFYDELMATTGARKVAVTEASVLGGVK